MTADPKPEVLRRGCELLAAMLEAPRAFAGDGACELLAQFFSGFPIGILGLLLSSNDESVAQSALFIADELGRRAEPVIAMISSCLNRSDPKTRYGALEAIGSCATREHGDAWLKVAVALRDPDKSCRKIAMLQLTRAGADVLASALPAMDGQHPADGIQAGLRWLASASSKDVDVVQEHIGDPDPLVRKFGVVAAGRLAKSDPSALIGAADSDDDDVRTAAQAQIQFMKIQRRRSERQNRNETGTRARA